jgi:DNA-binding SARP family transcriptional activator
VTAHPTPLWVELVGEKIHIRRRKALALSAYLAVTEQSRSRDALVTLLWSEYDQSAVRTDLHSTLSLLNRTVSEEWFAMVARRGTQSPHVGTAKVHPV